MQTAKLSTVLRGDFDDLNACVYIIRDGETVFYVGMTERQTPAERVRQHCGMGTRWYGRYADDLGTFIKDNAPASDDWQVDFLTLDDCVPYGERVGINTTRWYIRDAERAVIKALRPCLNGSLNDEPSPPVPARYKVRGIDLDNAATGYIPVIAD